MAVQPGDHGIPQSGEYLGPNAGDLWLFVFIIKIQLLKYLLQNINSVKYSLISSNNWIQRKFQGGGESGKKTFLALSVFLTVLLCF